MNTFIISPNAESILQSIFQNKDFKKEIILQNLSINETEKAITDLLTNELIEVHRTITSPSIISLKVTSKGNSFLKK